MSAPKMGSNRPLLPDFNIDGLTTYWRRLYPRKTADQVAADTGFPIETVKNWLKGRNGLRVPQLLVILAVYGPDALTACWGGRVPLWLDDAAMADAKARRKAQIAKLNQEIDALDAKRADTKEARG